MINKTMPVRIVEDEARTRKGPPHEMILAKRIAKKKGGREGEIFDVTWRGALEVSAASPTAEPRMAPDG